MRYLFPFLLLLCFALHAEDKPLPADAQKAIAVCDAAISKARTELVKSLKASLAKTTKAGDLTGANLIQSKIADIEKLLEDGRDLLGNKNAVGLLSFSKRATNMRLADWEELPGEVFTFSATLPRLDTGVNLEEGEVAVIVPCPGDLWAIGPLSGYPKVGYDSDQLHLMWYVKGEPKTCAGKGGLLVTGVGQLHLTHNDPGNPGDNWGSIRVKIVKGTP